ncbi:uncharacterized protein N7459_009353 [Penicillium hispanicum]|uniref:uncharacterized protein n=1 Tax=Penicillium hispanicum TaxID=1080232 RepID=UPI00254159F9|nr:uncharacterized protein N7459_009353 [Penicillium hispanicum]KAJ5569923.1 hypothetical protein N7459_009353 [Penicillium hispanicum]
MAEVVGTASAITSFVTLALQSSMILYQTIQSLHSRDKMIRELRYELDALQGVLIALEESIANIAVELTSLKQPLLRCKNACEEFNALLIRCTPHSTEERSSRRDWLKLRYMGEDISGFKNMLSGYKSTISIALAYANLRTTNTTRDVIEEYKDLIENTKYDLEGHLHEIRTRLQSASAEGPTISGYEPAELQMMEEETNSTQKSLDVCEQFLTLIDQSRFSLLQDTQHPSSLLNRRSSPVVPTLSWLINAEGLNSAQKEITSWKLRLMQHLYGAGRNMQGQQSRLPQLGTGQARDDQGFKDELHGTEELLEFCKRVGEEANQLRTHHFEDVSTGDYSRQAIVTTLEDLISAKRIKSGNHSYQALGRMADESIQSLFRHPGEPGASSNGQEEHDLFKGKGN